MAQRQDTKSARILALFLAFIMLGSVLVYAFGGKNSGPEREHKFEMGDSFKDYIKYVPEGYLKLFYLNFKNGDEALREIAANVRDTNMDYSIYRVLSYDFQAESKIMVIAYPDGGVYFIDVNKTRVFFTHDTEEDYNGYTVKFREGIALVDEVCPFVIGGGSKISNVIESFDKPVSSNYTNEFPDGDYTIVQVFSGDSLRLLTNGSDLMDFYIVGYGVNGSVYEKIVGIHFTQNAFLVNSNVTEYYNVTRGEHLNIAVMRDSNLTKLIEAQPEIRTVTFKLEDVEGSDTPLELGEGGENATIQGTDESDVTVGATTEPITETTTEPITETTTEPITETTTEPTAET